MPTWLSRCGVMFGLLCSTEILSAQESLQGRVDRLMDAAAVTVPAPICSDAEFLRRVSLDLVGIVPTSAEAKVFLDDAAPNKRELLVDRLLTDPRFPLKLAVDFHVMWMERRPDKHVPAADWLKYLTTSFQANKPYDQLVREILTADSADPAQRPAAKFLLDRDVDPHLLTRDIGRMFFGVDLQCAQCHDHPLIDDYVQTDYYGLYAFVSRVGLAVDQKESNKGYISEGTDGKVEYKSVFTGNSGKTRPRLPGGTELSEPRFPQGENYVVAPGQHVRTVPKYSRRAQFATALADGSHPGFRKNIANRLWAKLMGRGLVHAVDLHHSDNPPSHPEVLNLLADEMQAVGFQLKPMIRGIVLTKAYQRTIDVPTAAPLAGFNTNEAMAKWVSQAEQHAAAAKAAETEAEKLLEQLTAANAALVAVEENLAKLEAAELAAKKPFDDANAALAKAQQTQSGIQTTLNTVNEALAKGSEAAKALPNDAEVTQAVAIFQTRVTKLTNDLTAAEKAVTDQNAAVQAVLAKFNEARQAADLAYAQWTEAIKPGDVIKSQLVAVQNRRRAEHAAEQQLKQRIASLQNVMNQAARPAAIAAAEAAIGTAQAEQTIASQAVETQVNTVNQLTTAQTEVEKVRLLAGQQTEAAKAAITAKLPVVQSVDEAVGKTEAALAKLPENADLKAAVEKLKAGQVAVKQEFTALEQAVTTRTAEEQAAAEKLKAAQSALTAGQTELTARKQTMEAKTVALTQAVVRRDGEIVAGKETADKLVSGWTADFSTRDLKPLSPEQFGMSILQATGVIDGQRGAADAEVEKTVPKAGVANDAAQLANRTALVEQQTFEKLLAISGVFATFYGAAAGQPQEDFFATADQALFLANGGQVRSWAGPGNPLHNRLTSLTDPKAFAEELYLSALTRRPTEAEVAAVASYLASRPEERPAVTQEMIWALLASAEFRFQH